MYSIHQISSRNGKNGKFVCVSVGYKVNVGFGYIIIVIVKVGYLRVPHSSGSRWELSSLVQERSAIDLYVFLGLFLFLTYSFLPYSSLIS